MTIDHATIALALSVLSIIGTIYGVGYKMGRVELKVDTMWDFMMRRATSEAVMSGVATIKSPAVVNEEAKRWMAPLIGPIREFYAKLGRRMTDNELAMEIERRFGDRILQEVCIPHKLHMGACLLIAMQAAKDQSR